MEEADKRIDELSSSGRLDPALMLTMAKAYSAAKDTDYTREEVKDVMAHLYFKVAAKPFIDGSMHVQLVRWTLASFQQREKALVTL